MIIQVCINTFYHRLKFTNWGAGNSQG